MSKFTDLDHEAGEIIGMDHITKRFPGVVANEDVHLNVRKGAFHAVIGENGAGKSTLLNILYGRYAPDEGSILLHGQAAALRSPADAIRHGIGLVSQHHALIPALTVLENIMLGAEEPLQGPLLRSGLAAQRAHEIAIRLGLEGIDLKMRAERLSVAAQQKVEILKCLYRQAQILLLDEPTAMLAPQEANALFALLRTLIDNGATIVFVTHKLREVMAYSSAVTVLRAGRNAGDFVTTATSEPELLERMIGKREARRDSIRKEIPQGSGLANEDKINEENSPNSRPLEHLNTLNPLLQIKALIVRNARRAVAVQQVDLDLLPGEILGIAGVDGSGQRELAEAIVGLRPVEAGQMLLAGDNIVRCDIRRRGDLGIAYIPEDRHHVGMVPDFTIAENYLLGHERQSAWGGGLLLRPQQIAARAAEMIRRHGVNVGARGGETQAGTLSGGNQQKVVIARALDSGPRLLVACQPTRGLDPGATDFVYTALRGARDSGLGIILFSLDLDEIFALSDRIAVMFNGCIAGLLPRASATPEAVGALMTGAEIA